MKRKFALICEPTEHLDVIIWASKEHDSEW